MSTEAIPTHAVSPESILAERLADRPRPPWWALITLILLVLIGMGSLLGADFTSWDDPHTITSNPIFNPAKWGEIIKVWNPFSHRAALWVPVTYTLWGLIAEVSYLAAPDPYGIRLNPTNFHAVNLGVHVVTTLLVLSLLRRIIRRKDGSVAEVPAFFGAAVFAIHPVQVETVGWVSGLKDLLWGAFAVGAVVCYLTWLEQRSESDGDQPQKLSGWWYAGFACFVLGTLSKPTAMVTPALAVAVHAVMLGQGWRAPIIRGKLWVWFAFVPLVMLWTRYAQPATGFRSLEWYLRPLIATDSLAFYMGKVLLPLGLTFDYGRTPAFAYESGYLWWTWIFPAILALGLFLTRRRWPLLAGAGLWSLVALSPVLGAMEFLFQYYSTVADHYMYVAMVGVGIVVAFVLSKVPASRMLAATTLTGIVIAILTTLSMFNARAWHDSETLYAHAMSVQPRSFAALTNMGARLMARHDREPTRAELLQAIEYLKQASAVREDFPLAWDARSVALQSLSRLELQAGNTALAQQLKDDAIKALEMRLSTYGSVPYAIRGPMTKSHILLARYLLTVGRINDAKFHIERAQAELDLEANPDAGFQMEIDAMRAAVAAQPPTTSPAK